MDSKLTVGTTIDEVLSDPTKFGAPTFKEFVRDYDKHKKNAKRDSFGAIDKGSQVLGKLVQKHEFEIEGHRCSSLERVEQIAKDYGWDLHELDYRPEIIPQGGGKHNILIKFISKVEREKRNRW